MQNITLERPHNEILHRGRDFCYPPPSWPSEAHLNVQLDVPRARPSSGLACGGVFFLQFQTHHLARSRAVQLAPLFLIQLAGALTSEGHLALGTFSSAVCFAVFPHRLGVFVWPLVAGLVRGAGAWSAHHGEDRDVAHDEHLGQRDQGDVDARAAVRELERELEVRLRHVPTVAVKPR